MGNGKYENNDHNTHTYTRTAGAAAAVVLSRICWDLFTHAKQRVCVLCVVCVTCV